jgi:hypothetical protein
VRNFLLHCPLIRYTVVIGKTYRNHKAECIFSAGSARFQQHVTRQNRYSLMELYGRYTQTVDSSFASDRQNVYASRRDNIGEILLVALANKLFCHANESGAHDGNARSGCCLPPVRRRRRQKPSVCGMTAIYDCRITVRRGTENRTGPPTNEAVNGRVYVRVCFAALRMLLLNARGETDKNGASLWLLFRRDRHQRRALHRIRRSTSQNELQWMYKLHFWHDDNPSQKLHKHFEVSHRGHQVTLKMSQTNECKNLLNVLAPGIYRRTH